MCACASQQGALITPPSKNEYDTDAFEAQEQAEKAQTTEAAKADPFTSEREAFEHIFKDLPPAEGH